MPTIHADSQNPNKAKRGHSHKNVASNPHPQNTGKVSPKGTLNRCRHGAYLPPGETKSRNCWYCDNKR
jgi:hypothetical protein